MSDSLIPSLLKSDVSESLRSLMTKEQGREFAHLLNANSLICSDQMSDCERFAHVAQDKWVTVSKSLRWLMSKSNCERIAQVAHDKRATMSDSLRSLMIKERISEWLGFFSESLIPTFAQKN